MPDPVEFANTAFQNVSGVAQRGLEPSMARGLVVTTDVATPTPPAET